MIRFFFYPSICYTALVFFIVYHFVAVRRWTIFTARRFASAVYTVVVCLVYVLPTDMSGLCERSPILMHLSPPYPLPSLLSFSPPLSFPPILPLLPSLRSRPD